MAVVTVLTEIWCSTLNKPFGLASFVPLIRIKQACITCIIIGTETVFAMNPVSKTISVMYTYIVQHVVDLLDSDLLCYVENSITYVM